MKTTPKYKFSIKALLNSTIKWWCLMARIQFILKARSAFIGEDPFNADGQPKLLSSGLLNSATFVSDMLKTLGHETLVSHAVDNNSIDRLVSKFRPDICIIEAFWVVPEKFEILTKLHPKITWIVRNHSALPFLANEGIGMDWSLRYMNYSNVHLACNDARTNHEMQQVIAAYKPDWPVEKIEERVYLLSNYYPAVFHPRDPLPESNALNISCFGAIRPLKNHLAQAVAAIEYTRSVGKHLRFHINGSRIEMKGESIAHNLQKMFALLPYELIQHEWLPHDTFCSLLREMDVSLQVSYTETFNIVSADAVVNGVPVITGPDILWSDPDFQADPNYTSTIVAAIGRAINRTQDNSYWQVNMEGLRDFSENSKEIWQKQFHTILMKKV